MGTQTVDKKWALSFGKVSSDLGAWESLQVVGGSNVPEYVKVQLSSGKVVDLHEADFVEAIGVYKLSDQGLERLSEEGRDIQANDILLECDVLSEGYGLPQGEILLTNVRTNHRVIVMVNEVVKL